MAFIVLETVLVLEDKKISTQEMQFIEILHSVRAVYCYWTVLYTVHVTAFCLGWGGGFFPGHGVYCIVLFIKWLMLAGQ